jgi:hypothetical protein
MIGGEVERVGRKKVYARARSPARVAESTITRTNASARHLVPGHTPSGAYRTTVLRLVAAFHPVGFGTAPLDLDLTSHFYEIGRGKIKQIGRSDRVPE